MDSCKHALLKLKSPLSKLATQIQIFRFAESRQHVGFYQETENDLVTQLINQLKS